MKTAEQYAELAENEAKRGGNLTRSLVYATLAAAASAREVTAEAKGSPEGIFTYSETQERLAKALNTEARKHELAAGSRSFYGPAWASVRAAERAEVRRCRALRDAILAADPLELDALLDRR